ncbi:MAG: hypothetical protein HY225_03445 [Candidatus Vogelbacteria bacterium]|nr:hypothetical protein [Candidatus Vogelbacteria bacterium]
MLIYNPVDENRPEFEDGVVVVIFKPGVTKLFATAKIEALGLQLTSFYERLGQGRVSVPTGQEDHFVTELQKLTYLVDSAERSILAYIQKGGLL